ncbi:MAG: LacI family transcriptional regulator [Candidatus Omnitrophica bacterium]|nr:LacI family transcriptional regulator [Candidatus Omnitrophota bacterium]
MDTKTRKSSNIVEQIADELGIAVSTVYAILSDRKSCFASQKLKEQVKQLAAELGYRPNYIAVSLKKGKTGTIGLIVSDMYGETTLARIENMTKLAYKDRCHVFVGCSYDNPALEEELLQEFYYRRVDGIAIAPARHKGENKFLRKLIELKFPLLSFTHVENVDIDYVSTDYFAGGYMAGEHLIKMGYTRHGFIAPEIKTTAVKERFEGFKKALADNGYYIDESRIELVRDETGKEIEKGAERLLETDIDSVFCTNDRVASIFMKIALSKRKKIPQDLGIVGFDDTEIGRMCLIPLTSIKQKIEETTTQLYSALKRKIQGDNKPCRYLVKPELIERESTKRR